MGEGVGGHGNQLQSEGLHGPITWDFADTTDRENFVVASGRPNVLADVDDDDIGKWAIQLSDGSVWRLTSIEPNVWAQISNPALDTGWLAGCAMTVNVSDPAQYDQASGLVFVRGTGVVQVSAIEGIDPLNLATEAFTVTAINAAGDHVQFNRDLTDEERVTHAQLRTILHVDNATVTAIDNFTFVAEHLAMAVAGYVIEAGPLNRGNNYTAASNDLTVKKSLGATVRLMLEGATNPLAPNPQTNLAEDPVTFLRTIRDGGTSHTFFPTTIVPVGFWDNNSGALQATPKFVNHQFRFFNGIHGLVVGQATYDTLEEALAAAFIENPDIPASVSAERNNLRTILVTKGDVTDLSSNVDMLFLQVSTNFPGSL